MQESRQIGVCQVADGLAYAKPPLEFAKFRKIQNCWRDVFVNFGKNQECKSNMQK